MKVSIINYTTGDHTLKARMIDELQRKGFYQNGYLICDDSQDKDVMAILDKYLINHKM